jgi:ABC-type xylose transport system permease subunit
MSLLHAIRRHAEENFILASLILLILFFGFTSDNFFSVLTLTTVLNQLPALTTVTVGMTLVLIVAGIDLSVGSVLGFSATVVGVVAVGLGLPLPIACLVGIAAGLACGLVNGFLVAWFALPSFIVTLGMLEMARGMAYLSSDSQTVYIGAAIQKIALPLPYIGVSAALLISVALVVAGQYVLTRTVFGRYLIAIGTNEKAAQMSGIDSRPYRLGNLQRGVSRIGGPECRHRARAFRHCRCRHRRNQPDGGPGVGPWRFRGRTDYCRTTEWTGANRGIGAGQAADYRRRNRNCGPDRSLASESQDRLSKSSEQTEKAGQWDRH